MGDEERNPAVIEAAVALVKLRDAMSMICITSPAYMPGTGPTHADACKHVLDLMDHGIRQLAAFQGLDLATNSLLDATKVQPNPSTGGGE